MRTAARVLFVDNFDSFTFNLVDELKKRDCEVAVWRHDVAAAELLEKALAMAPPRLIMLSPGPGTPKQAGACLELCRLAAGRVPLCGICLGHQALVEAFGGRVGFAGEVVHGKADNITHDRQGIFAGLPSPLRVGRYHSLAAKELPNVLRAIAHTNELIMAVEHRHHPMVGLQFHPESILTPEGGRLMENILAWACPQPGRRVCAEADHKAANRGEP